MPLFLNNYEKGYSLTFNEVLKSAFLPPLSASVYAARHGDCAKLLEAEGKRAWGHRTIQVFEYIPVVGLLVAMIEKVCSLVYERFKAKEIASTESAKPLEPQTVALTETTPLTPTQETAVLNVLAGAEPGDGNINQPNPIVNGDQVETVNPESLPLTHSQETVVQDAVAGVESVEDNIDHPNPIANEKQAETVNPEALDSAPITPPVIPENPPTIADEKDDTDAAKRRSTIQSIIQTSETEAIIIDVIDKVLQDDTISEKDREVLANQKKSRETFVNAAKLLQDMEQTRRKQDQDQLANLKKRILEIETNIQREVQKKASLEEKIKIFNEEIAAKKLRLTELSTGKHQLFYEEVSYQPDDVLQSDDSLDPKPDTKTVLAKHFRGTKTLNVRVERDYLLFSTDIYCQSQLKNYYNSLDVSGMHKTMAYVEGERYSFVDGGWPGRVIEYTFRLHFNDDGVLPSLKIYSMIPNTEWNDGAIQNLESTIKYEKSDMEDALKEVERASKTIEEDSKRLEALKSEEQKLEEKIAENG